MLPGLKSALCLAVFYYCLIMQLQFVRARNKNTPTVISSTSENSYSAKTEQPPFLEYFMEHQVTEKEARTALLAMDSAEFNRKPKPWCDACTEKIRHYCAGPIFLKDHCCCDHRHEQERLPYIPHSCYIGESQCQPSAVVRHSCIAYDEIRECCCDQILKKQYKSIYSSANSIRWNLILMLSVLLPPIYQLELWSSFCS